MTGSNRFRIWLALALLLGLAAEPALAQRGHGQGKPPVKPNPRVERREERQASRPEGQGQRQGKQGQPSDRVPGQGFRPGKGGDVPGDVHPPGPFERLRQMLPDEQDRFLQNNPRFQRMRPEDQQRLRNRLQEWNALTPEAKQERLRRESILQGLSPQERRRLREEIFPRWQQLAPQRKQGIVRRLNALRGMSDEERDRRLSDAAFLEGLDREEQDILRTFARLHMWPPEPGSGPPGAGVGRPASP